VGRPSHPGRWLGAAAAAAASVALVVSYHSTVPYDPLEQAVRSGDVADVKKGEVWTFVYPISTDAGERATIVSAQALPNGETMPVAVQGLSSGDGYGVFRSPREAAYRERGRLVPLRGLRFSAAPAESDSAWLHTHVFLALTAKVLRSRGCLDLPALRLRYRVGGTRFERTVPASMLLAAGDTEASVCVPT
jgi:hypothetical protein